MEEADDSSPHPIRNPSPPLELQQNAEAVLGDSIGGTAFSKHWLFTTLMKLIQEVDRETEAKEGVQGSSEFGIDVDEDLQTELCKLWDMSMNSDVARFLQEFKAVEILSGVISKAQAPRVIEICVGILGNMACDQQVCEEISQNEKLVHLVLELLSSADPPTLVETTRLLYTSLSTKSVRSKWLEAIQQAEGFKEQVAFLFQSSTNCDLLKNTADFVDTLLDVSDDLCAAWASTELVDGLLEAIQQIGFKHTETLEVFLHIFQLLSTSETGVQALVERGEAVLVPLLQYLECVCEDEIVGLEEHCACLSSVFSLLNALFSSDPAIAEKLSTSAQLIRCMLKVLEPLYPIVHHKDPNADAKTDQASDSEKANVTSHTTATTEHPFLPSAAQGGNAEAGDMGQEMELNEKVVNPFGTIEPSTRQSGGLDGAKGLKSELRSAETGEEKLGTDGSGDAVVKAGAGKDSGDGGRAALKDMSALEEEEMRQLRILFDVLQAFLRDFVTSLQIDRTEEEYKGTDDENFTSANVPLFLPVLKYLDLTCSRCRINYLALTLTDLTPTKRDNSNENTATTTTITSRDNNDNTAATPTPLSENTEAASATTESLVTDLRTESTDAQSSNMTTDSQGETTRVENAKASMGEVSLVVHLKSLCLMFGQMRAARILDDVLSGRIVKRTDSGGF